MIEAKLFRDTELFGEMDPFVTIEYQGMEFRTKTAENAGKNPRWNEHFEIEIYSLQDDIKVTCLDDDFLHDDCVGTRVFKVRAICQRKLLKKVIPIKYKDKNSGDVMLETKFSSAELEKQEELGSEEEEDEEEKEDEVVVK